MFETDSQIVERIIHDKSLDGDFVDYERLRFLIFTELEKKSQATEELQNMIDSITGLWHELSAGKSGSLYTVVDRMELARATLVRESTVDHPGPYRLRLIASGNAEDILSSLERVFYELRHAAPDLRGLNAGSSLCDWEIQEQ